MRKAIVLSFVTLNGIMQALIHVLQSIFEIQEDETMNTQSAQDPVVTDSDKYKVVFENEHVRVLDYQDKPGEKTNKHRHPAFLLYALSPFKRHIHLENGKIIVREFKTGDTIWSDEQIHVGENVGETDSHALIVELKGVATNK